MVKGVSSVMTTKYKEVTSTTRSTTPVFLCYFKKLYFSLSHCTYVILFQLLQKYKLWTNFLALEIFVFSCKASDNLLSQILSPFIFTNDLQINIVHTPTPHSTPLLCQVNQDCTVFYDCKKCRLRYCTSSSCGSFFFFSVRT